jgi:hypothetical protein
VERWVGTPGALPVRVLMPSGMAELPCTHGLGADSRIVLPGEYVVGAAATAGLPPLSSEQPLVQPVSGVTEMCVVALTFTGAVERVHQLLAPRGRTVDLWRRP